MSFGGSQMEWYKDILINRDNFGPDTLIYGARIYYRYMDKVYIPKQPSELNSLEVAWLSEVRLKLADEIIDYDYSMDVVSEIYNLSKIPNSGTIIDFGCGGGMFLQYIKNRQPKACPSKILGLDISQYALDQAKNYFVTNNNNSTLTNINFEGNLFNEAGIISADDASFDGAISSFVMHFKIYESQMKEIYRVLKPGAKFCYNDYIYNKYAGHAKKVKSVLEDIGFVTESFTKTFKSNIDKNLKNHLIVIAKKPL